MNKLVIFLVALIPSLVLAPSLSIAEKDCKIPGSNPPHYNVTCEGLNVTQFNETIASLQHALNGTLLDEVNK